MGFRPKEILFSPTADCNLSCPHCTNEKPKVILSKSTAIKFLRGSKRIGIDRVGFTGGEPFLALNFLCGIAAAAAREGFLFGKIMTNAVWHRDELHLGRTLERLFESGYDGSICVSVDAFHKQNLKKIARFIEMASAIWRRPDIVSIVYVTERESATKKKLHRLAQLLKARLSGFGGTHPVIKSTDNNSGRAGFPALGNRTGGVPPKRSDGVENLPYHIKIAKIDLSPIGNASKLKDPWNGRWFKEDYCKGPGGVFAVTPSGDVKPCCGYAND